MIKSSINTGFLSYTKVTFFIFCVTMERNMAGVVKQDIPEISDFMSDFWKFMKSTWITEDISIHAPARGATCQEGRTYKSNADFNPRSREGSDTRKTWQLRLIPYFNPRSREGSDHVFPPTPRCLTISIHAPARGATFCP